MKKKVLEQIKEIVWATDLSKESKVCIPYIKFFNEKLSKGKVRLKNYSIFVLPKISEWVYERAFFSTDDYFAEIKNSLDKSLKKVKKYCDTLDLDFDVTVEQGIESEEIFKYIKKNEADVLFVGKRGISEISDLLIGSTTSRLIRNSNVPVFVVTSKKKTVDIKKILCPIDFGELSLAELNYSLSFAEQFGADLYTAHISEFFNYRVPVLKRDKLIETINTKITKIAKDANYKIKDTIYDMGEPAQKIIEISKKGKFDLIIMAANQKVGAERLLLGSITEKVLMHSKIPVLIIPPYKYVR